MRVIFLSGLLLIIACGNPNHNSRNSASDVQGLTSQTGKIRCLFVYTDGSQLCIEGDQHNDPNGLLNQHCLIADTVPNDQVESAKFSSSTCPTLNRVTEGYCQGEVDGTDGDWILYYYQPHYNENTAWEDCDENSGKGNYWVRTN